MAKVKLNGGEFDLAPLTSLQAAQLMDESQDTADQKQVVIVRRSLLAVAQSLANAGNPQGNTEDEAVAAVDKKIRYEDLQPAFLDVLEITGLKKQSEGEAPAADSTSGESSAA